MKGLLTIAGAGLVVGVFAIQAGNISTASDARLPKITATSNNRAEVERAIEHFRQAMIQRRPDWILADSAENLSFGHSNGAVQTREEFAETVRSGEEVFKRVDITKRHLTVSGNVAIERHHFSADIVYKGKLKTFELEVVEVWQKTNNRWRLLARQAIRI